MRIAVSIILGIAAVALSACNHPRVHPSLAASIPSTGLTVGVPGVPEPASARGNPPFYEVFGQRYYTMATAWGYREQGLASWYGTKFHGETTSSGEPYDMFAMTAAHRSLPLPTWVEVTNLNNGKRIVVRVNDRGPFVAGRIIDLSYAAAHALDMLDHGTARVEVRALSGPYDISPDAILNPGIVANAVARTPNADGPPPPGSIMLSSAASNGAARVSQVSSPASQAANSASTPEAAYIASAKASTAPPPVAPEPAPLFVQLGAFSLRDNAEHLSAQLRSAGLSSAFVVAAAETTDGLYRVRIGPVTDTSEYDDLVGQLAQLGIHGIRLVH